MTAASYLDGLREAMLWTHGAADDLLYELGIRNTDNCTPELKLRAMQVVATVKLYKSIDDVRCELEMERAREREEA